MSRKELPRAGLIKAALAGRITNRQAAAALHLTVRQVQRLKRRFESGGGPALRHRSRGQRSPRRLPAKLGASIAELMTTTYVGFNDVHLTEKLCEVHGLEVCRESVRRIRLALGRPAKRPRRAPGHRRRRLREAASGALIQVDGSPCAWLEARGPRLTLLGAIDDATGAILALGFRPSEDLHGYATLFRQFFVTQGLPVAIYGDRLNVFVRNDRHWTLDEELHGTQHPTHLGRMLQDLGVAYIAAHSPQAKGRIERLWATLQDRLTSELRLRGPPPARPPSASCRSSSPTSTGASRTRPPTQAPSGVGPHEILTASSAVATRWRSPATTPSGSARVGCRSPPACAAAPTPAAAWNCVNSSTGDCSRSTTAPCSRPRRRPAPPSPSCPAGRRAPIATAMARPRHPRPHNWLRIDDRPLPPYLSTPRNRVSSRRAHPAPLHRGVPRVIIRGADPSGFMSSAKRFERRG